MEDVAELNYYEVLGVSRDANLTDIKRAFRHKALLWHPDRNTADLTDEKRFKAAVEAYEVLRDPEKRRVYDLKLHGIRAGTGFQGYGRRRKQGRGCGRGRGRYCDRWFYRDLPTDDRPGTLRNHLVEVKLGPVEAAAGCDKTMAFDSVFGRMMLILHLPPGLEDGDVVRVEGLAGEAAPWIKEDIHVRINIASLSEEEQARGRKHR